MKNLILTLVMLITGLTTNSLNAQGTWNLQNNPTSKAGESMQFVSATEGWISLSSNQLLHTTNAGGLWSIVTPNSTDVTFGMDAPGSRINFISPTTGWAMKTFTNTNKDALGVVLYKTTDGGANWSRSVLSTTADDAGIQVQFVDANNGWVLIFNMSTGTPKFLKTTDGGANWTTTNGGGIFYYVNANVGYAFSAGPEMLPPYYIMKTTDGGTSWTPQYTDSTAGELNAIQFTDVNNGWIVGNNGKIFKTTDGGANWIPITNTGFNANYDYNPLSFINSTTGWIAARNNSNGSHFTLATTNGGLTWSTQTLPFNSDIYSMNFWDENNGWAASDSYNNNGIDYPGQIAKYSISSGGSYSNATLNGPWLFYKDLTPIDPYNGNLLYFFFDGNGNLTDLSGFGGPWTGNYTVSASGAISGSITNGNESFPLIGQLTSNTDGIGPFDGQNWRFHKIANPGMLKDKIVGTLTTTDCGSRNVTLNINSNGTITSANGLLGPVTGRVYADLGVYIGHMTTGEGFDTHWGELSIMGFFSNNNLVGQLDLDSNSTTCVNGTSNLVRSDNQLINSDWTTQTSGTVNSLRSVFFTDANNGYIVGGGQGGQTILKTTNGGNNWININSGTSYSLHSVFSTGTNTTYCVGGDGSPNQTILKTTNGGSNWTTLSGSGLVELKSVFFVDSNIGYAVGGGNNQGQHIILKTIDGGTNWVTQTAITSPNDLAFYSVFFTDANTGYIVGESGMSGTILKTTDGGVNWIQQTSGTGNHLYSVYFVDADTGFIVGNNGKILKTINGGINWISKTSGTSAKLYSVKFVDANLGFAVGESGTILKTINGGENWIMQTSGTTQNLNAVYISNNVGYAVGEAGIILKNSNVSLNVKENLVNNFISIYPNPNTGTFYFKLKEANTNIKVEIYNLYGQKVYEASNFEMHPQKEVNFAPQAKGIFIIKINDGQNSYSEKVIIQ